MAEWTDPRTWVDEIIIAEQMNTDIRDNIKFLYDKNYVFKNGIGNRFLGGVLNDYTLSLITHGNDVLITFIGVVTNTVLDYTVFDVKINDIFLSTLTTSSASHGLIANLITANYYAAVAIRFLHINLPAGIHTFKLYGTVISGTGTLQGGTGLFMVEEYGKL